MNRHEMKISSKQNQIFTFPNVDIGLQQGRSPQLFLLTKKGSSRLIPEGPCHKGEEGEVQEATHPSPFFPWQMPLHLRSRYVSPASQRLAIFPVDRIRCDRFGFSPKQE